MDFGKILKSVVAIVIVFAIWKYVVPWAKQEFGAKSESSTEASSGGDGSCVRAAERASEAWGSGLRQFVNPPYDANAWSSFRSDVDAKISAAESDCSCEDDSCTKARSAMNDLRSLVSDVDGAIRGGASFPGDAVQRQESIDNQINEAGDLVRSGK